MSKHNLAALEGMVLDGDEPVFNEPWEAQAFAMTVSLHQRDVFTWEEWAEALSEQIRCGEERSYYHHWLAALEKLATKKGLTQADAINARERQWHEAAARTPHGEAIKL